MHGGSLIAVLCSAQLFPSNAESAVLKPPGQRHTFHLNITDPEQALGRYGRSYHAFVPPQCEKNTGNSCPLLLWFHGWCDDALCPGCGWEKSAQQSGYVLLQPEGMADGGKGACNSWNIGTAKNTDICIPKDTAAAGDGQVYDSCRKLGLGNPCSLAFTCYDDVHFIENVVSDAKTRLNINLSKVYAAGGSNGGEFVYHLATSLALRGEDAAFQLLGIAPWYGAFMQGTLTVPKALAGIRVAHFHGLKDVTIPPLGGEAYDGNLYTPLNQTLDAFAQVNGCADLPENLLTPYGQSKNFRGCWSYRMCSHGGLVARCDFNAVHGFWEKYSAAMTWWLLTVDATAAVIV